MNIQNIINKTTHILKVLLLVISILILCLITISSNTNRVQDKSFFGNRFFIVLSNSMYPEFKSGDLIITKNIESNEIQKGDIITFYYSNGNVVTHQIYDFTSVNGKDAFITKGLNNNDIDEELVYHNQVIGKYTFSVPKLGILINFFRSTLGYVLFIATPLLIIIFMNSIKIIKILKKVKNEKTAKRNELLAKLEIEQEKYKQLELEIQSIRAKYESDNTGNTVVI